MSINNTSSSTGYNGNSSLFSMGDSMSSTYECNTSKTISTSDRTNNYDDIMEFVNSITANLEEDEEIKQIEKYEKNFLQMINQEAQQYKTNEPQTTSTSKMRNNMEDEDEEIDVVNVNTPSEVENIDSRKSIYDEIFNMQRPKENSEDEFVDVENVVSDEVNTLSNLLICSVDKQATQNKKVKKNVATTSSSIDDEIIDVVNVTDDTSNMSFYGLKNCNSQIKMTKRKKLNSKKKSRLTRSVITIDLINSSRDNNVIEILDSPVVPKRITEVIDVDGDEDAGASAIYSTKDKNYVRGSLGDCPVCLENFSSKEIMSTICGHVFCANCIKNVIKTTKKCPNCRKHLTLKSIHPLFI